MVKKPKRLGRGLSSLIGNYNSEATEHADLRKHKVPHIGTAESDEDESAKCVALDTTGGDTAPDDAATATGTVEARMVPVDTLRPNREQPRRHMEDSGVRELARSIAASGVIQPIVVRREPWGMEIVAGERRWRAAQLAGLAEVPVIVRKASDEEMLELALVENIHREDLNAIDRATAYRRYCDEFGVTADQLATRVGEDRTTVTNYLRLLELPPEVRELLARGLISMGHARSLAGVSDDFQKVALAALVASRGLSVRALENLVRRERRRPEKAAQATKQEEHREELPATVRDLEKRFEEVLETKVRIHLEGSKTRGRIEIEFYSVDDFERVCKKTGIIKN